MLCKKCGKNPCYERNGQVFALCAVCGWENLMELLDLPVDECHCNAEHAHMTYIPHEEGCPARLRR